MGNSNSSGDLHGLAVTRLEVVFSSTTMSSGMSAEHGSIPVVIGPSLQQLRLTLTSSEGLPITSYQPATAVDVVLRSIRALPGIDAQDWTRERFVRNVPFVEVVESRRVFVGQGTGNIRQILTEPRNTTLRLHYQDRESSLQRLVTFLKDLIKERGSTRLSVYPEGMRNLRIDIEANFTPTDTTLFTDRQATTYVKDGPTSDSPSGGGSQGLLASVAGLGSKLRGTMNSLAPILRSQGIVTPDLSASSPTNPQDLVALLGQVQPALAMLQSLGLGLSK